MRTLLMVLLYFFKRKVFLLFNSILIFLICVPYAEADTTVGGTISIDTTWMVADSPYVVTSNITVKGTDGADGITTLTIEPGVVVKLNPYRYIDIGGYSGDPGAMSAIGTAANPITFTSNESTPEAGAWKYIGFYNTTDDATTIMEHCVVEYGGGSNGSLYAYQSSPTFRNVDVKYSERYAAYVYNGTPDFENCTFSNNLNYDLYYRGTHGGSVTGSTINNGINQASSGTVHFAGNTINQNNAFPIKTYADNVGELSSSTFNNVDSASFMEVNSGTVSRDATWSAAIPFVIKGNITVKGTDGADSITTLTLVPDTVLKFNQSRSMDIGATSGDPGALVAHGNSDELIIFTSNKPDPAAGDWGGIDFNTTASQSSMIDYCVIEYAGYMGKSIFLDNRKVPVSNSIIRNNSNTALYVKGANCDGVDILCNTFEKNYTGIYVTGALPHIENNNFINNSNVGLRSYAISIIAENNWWNDAAGPNLGGDTTMGDVDAYPWSTQINQCSSGGSNNPPHEPLDPSPADNEVRVSSSGPISLNWTGGDPDAQDTVVYDVYLGTSEGNLVLDGQDVTGTIYDIDEPTPGITYYWQIKAKDNHGMEDTGQVWRFTTTGDNPDLIVSEVNTDPQGNLQTDQNLAILPIVQNRGTGPTVDSFTVEVKVDGTSIGTAIVDEVMLAGQHMQLSFPWIFAGGNSTIEVIADSLYEVSETDEQNNVYSATLDQAADMIAPALSGTIPGDGAFLQQVDQVAITLIDAQSAIDDATVISSLSVSDSSQQNVPGDVSESNDTFTFTPVSTPLADGIYTVSLTGVDIHGNSQNYSFAFTVDSVPPVEPVINGGSVTSGVIQARPAQNTANQFIVDLTGTRENDTAVLINGIERVALGDTSWSVQIQLQPGDNSIEVRLKDRAGNAGESVWVDIYVTTTDTIQFEYDAAGRIQRIHTDL